MPDFRAFADEIMNDLESAGKSLWRDLNAQQRGIVEQAAKDLAEATLLILSDPDNSDVHRSTILHIKSTLTTEATLAAVHIQNKLKASAERALMKLAGLGLSMLI